MSLKHTSVPRILILNVFFVFFINLSGKLVERFTFQREKYPRHHFSMYISCENKEKDQTRLMSITAHKDH